MSSNVSYSKRDVKVHERVLYCTKTPRAKVALKSLKRLKIVHTLFFISYFLPLAGNSLYIVASLCLKQTPNWKLIGCIFVFSIVLSCLLLFLPIKVGKVYFDYFDNNCYNETFDAVSFYKKGRMRNYFLKNLYYLVIDKYSKDCHILSNFLKINEYYKNKDTNDVEFLYFYTSVCGLLGKLNITIVK